MTALSSCFIAAPSRPESVTDEPITSEMQITLESERKQQVVEEAYKKVEVELSLQSKQGE